MKFKQTLFIFLVLLKLQALCQSSEKKSSLIPVTGIVLDSVSRQPIEYATVSLFEEGQKKPVNGAVSDSQGKFIVELPKSGYFKILIESIGYNPLTSGHVLFSNGKKEVYKYLLTKKANNLQGVTVIASQKLIENKIDKMVFNAEKDLTSQGGVATDILKKIPQVSVDVDGNVELAGSSSIRFLIDGKPSTAFGSNITDVLQSIPASEIKSIE
ncbi:MAG TPA: carboxypeptidase regulatory-like domain-containing protein, partial [Puia sp.]